VGQQTSPETAIPRSSEPSNTHVCLSARPEQSCSQLLNCGNWMHITEFSVETLFTLYNSTGCSYLLNPA